jgi:hypothetical protein
MVETNYGTINKTMKNLNAESICDDCVKIDINEEVSLEGSSIKILGPERLLIMSMKPTAHSFELCLYTGKPMFIELITNDGVTVQYVMKSGKDFYLNN